jgi:hypothetical protein
MSVYSELSFGYMLSRDYANSHPLLEKIKKNQGSSYNLIMLSIYEILYYSYCKLRIREPLMLPGYNQMGKRHLHEVASVLLYFHHRKNIQ